MPGRRDMVVESHKSGVRLAGRAWLLLTLPFVAGAAANGCGGGTSAGGSGTTGEAGSACMPKDCTGPAPGAPSVVCSDGSIGGPVCSASVNGACGWQIRSCPTDACPGLG